MDRVVLSNAVMVPVPEKFQAPLGFLNTESLNRVARQTPII